LKVQLWEIIKVKPQLRSQLSPENLRTYPQNNKTIGILTKVQSSHLLSNKVSLLQFFQMVMYFNRALKMWSQFITNSEVLFMI